MLLALLFFLSNPSYPTAPLNLRSLSDFSSVKIDRDSRKPKVFMLFQKDCHACRQQAQDLNCLQPLADVFLVGSFSSESDLRDEYRRLNTEIPGLYGGLDFRKTFNIRENLTPQIILSQGTKKSLIIGLTPCLDITTRLQGGRHK